MNENIQAAFGTIGQLLQRQGARMLQNFRCHTQMDMMCLILCVSMLPEKKRNFSTIKLYHKSQFYSYTFVGYRQEMRELTKETRTRRKM